MPRRLPLAADAHAANRLPLLDGVRDVDRSARPLYVVWEITLACDLGCVHCGSRAGEARDEELSTDEALDLVDQMHAMGVREVSLIGGEVYLREDWDRIARRIADHGMIGSIVTGGRGFTREIAKRAKDAGVRGVGVSVDGLERTHDKLRGRKGSFGSALEALGHLRDVGMPRAVNTQINQWSKDEIEGVFETVAPLGIYGWQTQFTVAMGRAADRPDMLLQPFDLLELMPRLAKLKARCDDAKIRFEPGNNVGYFGPFEEVFRGKLWRGHTEPCTAGKSTMGIEADGAIKGCPSLPTEDFTGGNIRETPLQEIWQRAPALRFTRARGTEDLWGFCATCYYKEACLAGCTWTSHVLSGKRGNNPYCHHRALELLEQGKRERIRLVERAPGAPFDFGRFAIEEEPWPSDELAATQERYLP
jgi:radical SAM protein with 4Fe4S-binding SPASM domain